METGKRRINSAGRGLAARVEGDKALAAATLVRPIARAVELEREIDPVVEPVPGIDLVVVRAQVIVPVAEELEHGPVVAELVLAPAVAELEHGQVAVELVLVPEEAEPVHGHPHDLLAVLLGTKSVTAARHRGLAPVPAAEDLEAVAETTREPAAAEAVAAWAAAA